jgi:hypothetical protein
LKKQIPEKTLTPDPQQQSKAMIISNLKPQLVVAPPEFASYTLNPAK